MFLLEGYCQPQTCPQSESVCVAPSFLSPGRLSGSRDIKAISVVWWWVLCLPRAGFHAVSHQTRCPSGTDGGGRVGNAGEQWGEIKQQLRIHSLDRGSGSRDWVGGVVLCLCLSFGGNKLTASEWINGKCLRPAASHHRQCCTITAEPIICDYWDCAHVWRIKVSPQFDPFHLQQIVDIQHQCIKAAHTDNQLCKAKTHSHLPSSRPHSQEHHYPYPSRERSCLFISESILYTSRRTTSGRLR